MGQTETSLTHVQTKHSRQHTHTTQMTRHGWGCRTCEPTNPMNLVKNIEWPAPPRFIRKRRVWKGVFICTTWWPHPQMWVMFESIWRVRPKFCLEQTCSAMDFNKAVLPWRRKSWRKRYRGGGKGTGTRWGCRIIQNCLQELIEGTWQSLSLRGHLN